MPHETNTSTGRQGSDENNDSQMSRSEAGAKGGRAESSVFLSAE